MLGLEEAGQKILHQTMKLARDLNILDVAVKLEGEEMKIEPIRLPYTSTNKESTLADLTNKLKESETPTRDISKIYVKPDREYTGSRVISAAALAELIDNFSPLISGGYGFSMIRIDLDEMTLRNIGEAFYMDGKSPCTARDKFSLEGNEDRGSCTKRSRIAAANRRFRR